jgi:hypothetical protein
MSVSTNNEWRSEFGIATAGPRDFFSSKEELNTPGMYASQGHVLRRAFDLLELDGVLCTENAPLVYFKLVKRIDKTTISKLHRTFWNHGGAPVLVLIADDEVHIYSGLVKPGSDNPGLVETIRRSTEALKEFLPSVESGTFFTRHSRLFDPANRVDRELLENLQATRDKLKTASGEKLDSKILDALLCRLVFACYLFDREVVGEAYLHSLGLRNARHLRDVLGVQHRPQAKRYLYELFKKLGQDFNGDLFSDNLDAEARVVHSSCIDPLDEFFRATDVATGQTSFWPYDFAVIPVEAISAIYERFLHSSDKSEGAFYTPRFLAELVLDLALSNQSSLLGKRYLDPACGSGIFLVTLFNRMAEEWKQANPTARNDRRARELREILCNSLFGIDVNPTACRITAFSLYLAYLDQLSPRDVLELGAKGHKLPKLVHYPEIQDGKPVEGHIWCDDFFGSNALYPTDVDLVIGNPPWGSTADKNSPAGRWCSDRTRRLPLPDNQIATAFIWKAAEHVDSKGQVCLVVPHSTLFNHTTTSTAFQKLLFSAHTVERVLNLADYRFFLFAEARHPALVITYRKNQPRNLQKAIDYWSPKSDWLVMQTDVITIAPEDRASLKVEDVLRDLEGKDGPQVWKQRYWATARDRRLIDRLSLNPRLRDFVRQPKDKDSKKRWTMAAGLQPLSENDDPVKAEVVSLPGKLFIEAASASKIDLFLLPSDCTELKGPTFTARSGSNKDTTVFKAPHVLVTKGFTRVAFASFDVSFQDFLRGIHGPEEDRDLLAFLAAYLRSNLARFYLFHTSSHWGITRQQVHIDELLRLPFCLPESLDNPARGKEIVQQVSQIMQNAASEADGYFIDRAGLVRAASVTIEPLLDEYFDILPNEQYLIADTVKITIPSVLPSRKKVVVPTIMPAGPEQRETYIRLLCKTLNGWSKNGPYTVRGVSIASEKLGIGIAVLEKASRNAPPMNIHDLPDVLAALDQLSKVTKRKLNSFELLRGTKIFDGNSLYLVKQIGQRFWSATAALNDADEIASTILMQARGEV